MSAANKTAVAANVAIIVTCALLVTIVVATRGPQMFRSAPPAPYQVGDLFSEVGPDPGGKGALVLVFRTNCIPCRDSAPFHRTLTKAIQTAGTTRVFAISSEPTEVTSAYLKENDIPVATVKSTTALRVRSTPTLFWLDSKGVIKDLWIGRLPREREVQVLRTLSLSESPSAD